MNLRDIINKITSLDKEQQLVEGILKEYSVNELFTFDNNFLSEDVSNLKPFSNKNWSVDYSNAFKKGMKKYRNNPKISNNLVELEKWIISHDKKPEKSTFPPKFNVHKINKDPIFSGAYDAHILGSNIISLFYIENDNDKMKLRWVYLGDHKGASPHIG